MNSTGVKNENDVQGFRPPAPGRYHVVVKAVDESFSKMDAVRVEFEVLAGTIPGQEHLTHTENMFLRDGGGTDQHLRFALVTALIQAGTEADVNLQHAVGRQLIIGLEKKLNKKDGKEYTNLAEYGMAMWSLDNPEVRDVPRLQQQPTRQAPQPTQQQYAPPQQQTYQQPPAQQQQYAPPPQQQQAASNDGWGSI